jgi:hypothetical protein
MLEHIRFGIYGIRFAIYGVILFCFVAFQTKKTIRPMTVTKTATAHTITQSGTTGSLISDAVAIIIFWPFPINNDLKMGGGA